MLGVSHCEHEDREMQLDVNKGMRACERVWAAENNVLHRRNLGLVIDHMYAEARCDVQGVLDTLVVEPKYVWHGQPEDVLLNPQGSHQAIAASGGIKQSFRRDGVSRHHGAPAQPLSTCSDNPAGGWSNLTTRPGKPLKCGIPCS